MYHNVSCITIYQLNGTLIRAKQESKQTRSVGVCTHGSVTATQEFQKRKKQLVSTLRTELVMLTTFPAVLNRRSNGTLTATNANGICTVMNTVPYGCSTMPGGPGLDQVTLRPYTGKVLLPPQVNKMENDGV